MAKLFFAFVFVSFTKNAGFGFNNNLLTAHEHVANNYIDAYMYIRSPVYIPAFVMPLLETVTSSEKRKSEVSSSYRVTKHRKKPSHSRAKRKSLIIIRIQEALWRKLNNLKPLFSGNEEHCISKEVKGNALASKGKSCRPETTITAENACHDLSV